jgi:hypothetical protein
MSTGSNSQGGRRIASRNSSIAARSSFGAHDLRGRQRCRSGEAGLYEFTSVHRR